jgi:4-carboxymuconolactone decarboxylase
MLRGCHGELHDFVLDTAYGRILSRPGLSPRMRELIAVGVLALTDQVPQMIAHGRGARKFGATVDELREAIYTGVEDEDRTSQLARRV